MLRHTVIVVAVVWVVSGLGTLALIAWDALRDQDARRRMRGLLATEDDLYRTLNEWWALPTKEHA